MMHRKRHTWKLLFATGAVLSFVLFSGCRGDLSQDPPIHLNPNMDNQTRFDPQEENKFFKDHRAMRSLVPGTVARGFLRADSVFYRGKDAKGKFVKQFPKNVKVTKAFLARGKERYGIYCTPCHGATGDGQGAFTRYTTAVSPKDLQANAYRTMPVGKLYHVIANGTDNKMMPAYNLQLTPQDRWAVVAYVRALQLTKLAPQKGGKK